MVRNRPQPAPPRPGVLSQPLPAAGNSGAPVELGSGGPRGQRPSRIPTCRYPQRHPNLGVRGSKSERIHIHCHSDETTSPSASQPVLPEEALGKNWTLSPWDSHRSGPRPAPKCSQLYTPVKSLQGSPPPPQLFRVAECSGDFASSVPVPGPESPVPLNATRPVLSDPGKHPGATRGPVAPAPTEPQPPGPSPPRGAGRSPVARLVVALRGGRAAGRGRRTARGAGFANLRRRSPRYVYLGRLTPALPAGSARALARAPVGHPGASPGRSGESVHAGCGCEARGGDEGATGGRAREWVGRGRRRCSCSPGPALAPPPPGGRPCRSHSPAGRAKGTGEGDLKSLPSFLAPPPPEPPLGPPRLCGSPSWMTPAQWIAPSPLYLRPLEAKTH